MRLFHYGREHLTQVLQAAQEPGNAFKPQGLWVSVDDAWLRWCKGESFHLKSWTHATEVILAPEASVLHLKTSDEVRKFHKKYSKKHPYLSRISEMYDEVDWGNVAYEHDGLLISPYQWGCRLEIMWYYGWDVASGCIWNPAAVSELRPIDLTDVPHHRPDEDEEVLDTETAAT